MSDIISSTYEIIREMGSDGGGVVYLANHIRLDKKVILKADKRRITTKKELLRREVDVLKNLNNEHIPRVYDYFVEGDTVYTVMDFVAGESLDKPLRRGEKFSQPQVIKWAKQLLAALDYLHSPVHGDPPRGYVHSDIKPANLMRTPENDVVLIDFNIALALGETHIVGHSPGYASPEHYGLDYSIVGLGQDEEESAMSNRSRPHTAPEPSSHITETALMDGTVTLNDTADAATADIQDEATLSLAGESTFSLAPPPKSSQRKMKAIVPDVRSDIYSLGATLYHLLSGIRPANSALEVAPLSETEFSPQVIGIIKKAMNPNPDLRYQTAAEMLDDFEHLWDRDPRLRRMRTMDRAVCPGLLILLILSICTSFVGLKRMQTVEQWLKLAEYSQDSYADGDSAKAVAYALQALPTGSGLLQPGILPQVQRALTNALGVYDLSDGYKIYETVELPSEPLYISLAPDGKSLACIYSWELSIIDTASCQITDTLPVVESALAEVEYIDDHTIVYSGQSGIAVYDTATQEVLWTGERATGISISGDGSRIAAVYRDSDYAVVYDASDGTVCETVDFGGRRQSVAVNDVFANPRDNLFALNQDGSMLGVSFDDGSLEIFDLGNAENGMEILESGSGYTHFEGGFSGQYFAFSASGGDSLFAVIDTEERSQTGGFQSTEAFSVTITEAGICVQTENLLVLVDPETGEQTPLVTSDDDIRRYATDGKHTIISTASEDEVFNEQANQIAAFTSPSRSDFVALAEGYAVLGSMDSPSVRILRYEESSGQDVLAYDTGYYHNEARLSPTDETVMLFSYVGFRIFDFSGERIADVELPDAEEVYDQQFERTGDGAILKVTYNDGRTLSYSARTGELLNEESGGAPDSSLQEEFETDEYRIVAPLHGSAEVYDRESGKLLWTLEEDAYLTYATQLDDAIVVQYITADGYCYGQLLDSECEVLADLPYLCDVYDNTLVFDYPSGNVRQTRIFNIDELIQTAKKSALGNSVANRQEGGVFQK